MLGKHLYTLDNTSAEGLSNGSLCDLSPYPWVIQGLLGSWPIRNLPDQQAFDKVLCATANAIPAFLVEIQLACQNGGPAGVRCS